MQNNNFTPIIEQIISLYGGKKIELDYNTPFQLLCAVILSAQTTDRQVNRVTPNFFKRVQEARDVVTMPISEIESLLQSINFFRNKSKYIKATGERIAREFHGTIPGDIEVLTSFPGIGTKTAKVVLSVLYDFPYVGVDTHIHRVMNRIGIVDTKNPEQTDKEIDRIFDNETKKRMHHPLVLFGRYRCQAKKPHCSDCPLRQDCKYYHTTTNKNYEKSDSDSVFIA